MTKDLASAGEDLAELSDCTTRPSRNASCADSRSAACIRTDLTDLRQAAAHWQVF